MLTPYRKGYYKKTVSNTYNTAQDTTYTIPYPYIRPRLVSYKVAGGGAIGGVGAGRFLSGNTFLGGGGGGGGGHGDTVSTSNLTTPVTRNGPVRAVVGATAVASRIDTDGSTQISKNPGTVGGAASNATGGIAGASPIQAGVAASNGSASVGGAPGAGGAVDSIGEGTNSDGGLGGHGMNGDGSGQTSPANGNAGWIQYTIEYLW